MNNIHTYIHQMYACIQCIEFSNIQQTNKWWINFVLFEEKQKTHEIKKKIWNQKGNTTNTESITWVKWCSWHKIFGYKMKQKKKKKPKHYQKVTNYLYFYV